MFDLSARYRRRPGFYDALTSMHLEPHNKRAQFRPGNPKLLFDRLETPSPKPAAKQITAPPPPAPKKGKGAAAAIGKALSGFLSAMYEILPLPPSGIFGMPSTPAYCSSLSIGGLRQPGA